MPSNPTRRSFIAASLVASAAVPKIDALAEVDVERLRLIQRREYLQSEIAKLDRQWALAYAKLPCWCKAGPKYKDELGAAFGPTVGWPEINSPIQISEELWLSRPSPGDLRGLIEQEIPTLGRSVATSNYRLRVKNLRDRLRLRREIHESIDLPVSRDWERFDLELEVIEEALSGLLTGEQINSCSPI